MKKSATRTVQASGRLHRTSGVGVRAGRFWPRPVLTLAVLLLAVVTLGGVFAVAQAQQADGTMDGVTLASDAPGALTVSWETPSPAPTDYRLRWAPVESDFLPWKDGNETDRGNAYPAGDATSLTLSGLPEGTEFKLQVRARYHKGEYKKSPWSGPWAEASALVMSQPPDVPDPPNLAATAVTPAGHVLVVWLNPSDDSITGYQVLRGPDAGSLAVIEEDTGSSGTSYTDTEPPAGQTHTYAVKARNAAGLSPLSNTVTATVPAAEAEEELITARPQSGENTLVSNLEQAAGTLNIGGVLAVAQAQQVDGTMDGVTLASDAPGALTVFWNTPSPAPTDYRLRWAPVESDFLPWNDGNETDRGNAYPAGDATSLTLSGLPEGTEFKVQVRARYHKGEYKKSPWSGPWAEASALVMSQPPDVPDGPRDALVARGVRDASAPSAPNLAATGVTPAGHVLVLWLNPSDESITGYQVLRGPDAASLVVIEEDTGSSGTSYTDTAPPAGQTHTYAVKARNAAGLSPLSNTLTATVPAAEAVEDLTTARHESAESTLVSNLGQAAHTLNAGVYATAFAAQEFTTGNNPSGYHVTEVDLYLRKDTNTPMPVVTIQGDNSGIPDGTALLTFTTASDVDNASYQLFTFTTGDRNRLRPNTRYWLHAAGSTSDEMQMQTTASDNEDADSQPSWQIRDSFHFQELGQAWSSSSILNSLRLEIRGHESDGPTLVSNLGQTTHSSSAQATYAIAQSFFAGRGPAGFNYRFQGIRVLAHGAMPPGAGGVVQPQMRAGLHRDNGGRPGSLLHPLGVPPDFASTGTLTEYTLSASPGAVLRGGARYWIVLDVLDGELLIAGTTSSTAEDQAPPPVDGWLIDNRRHSQRIDGGWTGLTRVIKLAVYGEPEWVTDEADGEDLPGAGFNAHQTTGVVTPGTVSSGNLTAGLDRNQGHTGDYWHLATKWGHSYRVEVKFGDSPDIDTGGSAWIYFIDGDRTGTCCDSDHNRDDGVTLLHVKHDRNRRYLVNVAAFDQLNTGSAIYNGPYTITMTDITGTEKVTTNLYLGTRTDLSTVGSSRQYAVSFRTGHQDGGYELDRIDTHISNGNPSLALHADTSFAPGDKVCDFRNPSVVQHRVYTRVVPFLAPDCAGQRLAPSTTYWIVFAGTNYKPKSTDTDNQLTRRGGWSIGNTAVTKTTGAWSNLSSNGTIPVAIWAR